MFDRALSELSARVPSAFSVALRTYDWIWDLRHGVETRQYVDRLTAEGSPYQPVNPRRLDRLLDLVPQPAEAATFVDVGSGKGRALLVAARRRFRAACGVEYSPALHDIAELNLRRYRGVIRSGSVSLIQCDARSFDWPLTPLVLLFFNPFPQQVMTTVIERLKGSLSVLSRPVTILCAGQYTVRQSFEDWPGLRCLRSTPAIAVYHRD
jgi:SAM-dependent methyltransferase